MADRPMAEETLAANMPPGPGPLCPDEVCHSVTTIKNKIVLATKRLDSRLLHLGCPVPDSILDCTVATADSTRNDDGGT